MSQTPTLEYRVTLPQRAPRPYQTLAGLLGYPSLTFDAFHDLGVPQTTRKRTLPHRSRADDSHSKVSPVDPLIPALDLRRIAPRMHQEMVETTGLG